MLNLNTNKMPFFETSEIQLKLLNVITDNVINQLKWLNWSILTKFQIAVLWLGYFIMCFIEISFSLSQIDHIKRLPLFYWKEILISCAMLLLTTKRFVVSKQVSFLVAFKVNFILWLWMMLLTLIKISIKLKCFTK